MHKSLFLLLLALTACRTTGSGTPPSELEAWQSTNVKENAKKAFITAIQTCVPMIAEAIQKGRGEQIQKLLNRSEVERFVNIMLDYTKKPSDIDPTLKEFYENEQKPFDCDPLKGYMPSDSMAEYVVLEFINKAGLLRLGFARPGELLSAPPAP